MKTQYNTKGTCSTKINVETSGNIIENISFVSGCNGNLNAISALVKGMSVEEAVLKLKGITCGSKNTSCADQLTYALLENIKLSEEKA